MTGVRSVVGVASMIYFAMLALLAPVARGATLELASDEADIILGAPGSKQCRLFWSNGKINSTCPIVGAVGGGSEYATLKEEVEEIKRFVGMMPPPISPSPSPSPPPPPPSTPPSPPSPPPTFKYIGSDITPSVLCSRQDGNCHGSKNAIDEAFGGGTISIAGRTFAKGYGMHTDNSADFNLARQYTTFSTCIGNITPGCQKDYSDYTMKFRVQVDGSIKYGWKELRNDASAVCFEVSIAGALTLTLETESGPKGGSCTHSGFADAKVV